MDFVNEKLEEFNKFLDGKKVAIIGMGVSNVPLLDYFYDKNAKVTVFDKRNLSDEIMEKINKYRYEVIIRSKDVKAILNALHYLKSTNISIDMDTIY